MILFPAIDLKDGACVRLVRGDLHRIAERLRSVNPMNKKTWSRA
jgi:phosphoribosylformimino-5-aminoimidazole carboxamide ribonucleotide (ProFAR) isomerase